MKLAVLMDPIETVYYHKDSTLALLWEAQNRGWPIFYVKPQNLFAKENAIWMTGHELKVFKDPQCWFSLGEQETKRFDEFDLVLMRKDPPFDMEYLYATYLLEQGESLAQGKTLVVNSPRALRDWNEKLAILNFPQVTPPTLVTSNKELLRAFWEEHQEIVLKPLDSMGGQSVCYIRKKEEPNFNVMVELLTARGTCTIMAQKFIPEIRSGDKRILMVYGEPIPYALARVPAKGEFRGNLAAGGEGKGAPLSARDLWICEQIGPSLQEKGLWFVGLDVIGDYLTEINITSPTCIRELENLYPTLSIAEHLLNKIEQYKLGNN